MSLDVVRTELEATGRSHQAIAGQMKQELEEPLAAMAGGLKERRKIIQTGIEKLLQTKNKQTNTVNKARDRYEQDCLKIKGYLAQGHMVMGQEERKNKAKLEKTQIQMSATSQEYEAAVKVLEETTGRWNREWKAACDVSWSLPDKLVLSTDRIQKFQDLEEERLDFTKSSLWSFANIASTVCVSDDASCEKIRLSLEDCDVEKDITGFIKEQGTGQEIPDPPKYINFCRGDIPDNVSEASDEGAYSVAQFARAMNPAFRTSSPQPSTYSSHHDPASAVAMQMGMDGRSSLGSSHRQPSGSPVPVPSQLRQPSQPSPAQYQSNKPRRSSQAQETSYVPNEARRPSQPQQPQYIPNESRHVSQPQYTPNEPRRPSQPQYIPNEPRRPSQPQQPQQAANLYADIPKVPHNEYPMEGMTQFCRLGPPSERSSIPSPTRSETDSHSEYSNPTSFSSFDPVSGHASPTKQFNGSALSSSSESPALKEKKSGFFQNRSPFRRKSKHEKELPSLGSNNVTPTQRMTWAAPSPRPATSGSPTRPLAREPRSNNGFNARPTPSPELDAADPRANFQLNIGNNVFDVASPDARKRQQQAQKEPLEDLDPIAQALAELKGVTKQASTRISADRYHGISTPAPSGYPRPGHGRVSPLPMMNHDLRSAQRGTPPPSYDRPASRLGAPQPAFTSKQMQQTTASYMTQKRDMFGPGGRGSQASPTMSRPGTREGRDAPPGQQMPRTTSPVSMRSTSPRPYMASPNQQQSYRAPSPNPYNAPAGPGGRPRAQSTSPVKQQQQQPNYGGYNSNGASPAHQHMPRATSPNPHAVAQSQNPHGHHRGQSMPGMAPRPTSSRGSAEGGNAVVLAPAGGEERQRRAVRPTSQYYGADGGWAAAASAIPGSSGGANGGAGAVSTRMRSQSSAAGSRQITKDGRPILNYCKFLRLNTYYLCFGPDC